MKNNRNGQSSLLSNDDYSKIRKQITARKYKLLLDLAWYTGERWGAITKLLVEDVYDADGKPRELINFRARTRKATPDGQRKTRQVPVHPVLSESLAAYQPGEDVWLFSDRAGDKPISLRWADRILRTAVDKAGLSAKGISTHSTRRTFITRLARKGVRVSVIQKATGHSDLKVLSRYIEVSEDEVREAISTL